MTTDKPTLVAHDEDGPVAIGDIVTSFRGELGTLQAITRGPQPGKDAKVQVDGGEYYARVWGLIVTERAETASE